MSLIFSLFYTLSYIILLFYSLILHLFSYTLIIFSLSYTLFLLYTLFLIHLLYFPSLILSFSYPFSLLLTVFYILILLFYLSLCYHNYFFSAITLTLSSSPLLPTFISPPDYFQLFSLIFTSASIIFTNVSPSCPLLCSLISSILFLFLCSDLSLSFSTSLHPL